jgi:hypothetical protein
VLKHIAHRRVEDRLRLNRILDSEGSSDIRNFQEQETLLGGAQARVADLDMEKLSDAMRACCGPHQLEHFPITSHHILRRRDSFGIRLG